jgi:hypothetical protein
VSIASMTNPSKWLTLALIGWASMSGCGKDRSSPAPASQDRKPSPPPAVDAFEVPPLGVEQIRRLAYPYGDGASEFEKASAAYKAKPRDWAAVRLHSESALKKDSYHLEAHRLLARALGNDGDYRGAAAHLILAMAADWPTFGPTIATDPDLVGMMSSPVGQQLTDVTGRIKGEYLRLGRDGLWVIGRRSGFKIPAKPGVQSVTSRGEVYAFDPASKRYLRLTQTEHSVAGFLLSPSRKEIALIGYTKIEVPADASGKTIAAALPPLLARGYVLTVDAMTFEPLGKRAILPKGRQLSVAYGPGEQLLAGTAPAAGRWEIGNASWFAIDRSTGGTSQTQAATSLSSRLDITLEDGVVSALAGAFTTTSKDGGDPEVVSQIAPGADSGGGAGVAIAIPESGGAHRDSIAVAPDGARLAFATATDPCSTETAPSLYVADTRTGSLKHVLTGKSRFTSRWLDATTLAYEDPEGNVRLWDATTGREAQRLTEKFGIALAFLALSPSPLCKTAPPVVDVAPANDAAGARAGDSPPAGAAEGAGDATSGAPVTSP